MFDYTLHQIGNVIVASWQVLGEMSPYLLFGFLMAGALSIFISPEWTERHLGGRGFRPVLNASLLGAPMPLCSCGVIPVAASLRRHGAGRAATVSFLLSTPQTGIDNILVVWGMLGPVFAAFSPIAALVTGMLGGGLVLLFGEKDSPTGVERPKTSAACGESCCTGNERHNAVVRALQFGFLVLPRDIAKSLLFGVVVAGVISAFVPAGELKPYLGNEFLAILAMIALGIPLYVCATASVPIAASLIHLGASPGAALAFLIAGPATNAATVSTAWKMLGKRSTLLYLATIALSAILCGLTLDWLVSVISIHLPALAPHEHHHMESSGWTSNVWAVALLAVMALSYLWPSKAAAEPHEHDYEKSKTGDVEMKDGMNDAAPERLEFTVSGMTCDHCAAAVTRALKETTGVHSAAVDLATGHAVVSGVGLDSQKLVDAVKSLGYEAASR
jgi:uncharacterized protein